MVSIVHLSYLMSLFWEASESSFVEQLPKSFWGALGCLSQLSTDEVKAWQSCFESPVPRGRCQADLIRIPCSIILFKAKKDGEPVPYSGQLGKISSTFPL